VSGLVGGEGVGIRSRASPIRPSLPLGGQPPRASAKLRSPHEGELSRLP